MALRRHYSDTHAAYSLPTRGVNLRDSEAQLQAGEARLMQNCHLLAGVEKRLGSTRVTTSSLGAFKVRGGIKFYRADATAQRLMAYSTKVVAVSDVGVESVLNSAQTSDKDTFFTPWSVTDECYVANNTNTLASVNNAGVFAAITGTNIPSPLMVAPLRDRLIAITNNGLERTNARVDDVWSTNSTWATLRPTKAGRFTAIHPYSFTSSADASGIVTALLAFQANSFYLVSGTNFGTDVTAATASTGENSSIVVVDERVGTSSPFSVTTVPGLGTFWFTTDLNVYFLPFAAPSGRYIGDRIISTSDTTGINDVNTSNLAQVVMTYWDRKLILGIPTGTRNYPDTYYWLDVRSLIERPDRGFVWYGPMTGPTVGRFWPETQGGDNTLFGAEGNSATGAFVYKMLQANTYTDAVGTADNNTIMIYQPYFKPLGSSFREKYLRSVSMTCNSFSGAATMDVIDLSGTLASSLAVEALNTI